MPRTSDRLFPHPVREWRRLYGIKQSVLARRAALHVVTLSRIENGAEPNVTSAIRICRALSQLSGRTIGVEDVFGDDDWDAYYRAERDVHSAIERSGQERPGARADKPERLPAEPFADWLRKLMERDNAPASELAERFGMTAQMARAIIRGERATVDVAVIERAVACDGTCTARELYPVAYL